MRIRLAAVAVAVVVALGACSSATTTYIELRPTGHRFTGDRAVSTVAEARGEAIEVYETPGGAQPRWRLSNPTPEGVKRVLLAVSYDNHWIEVLVPVRPNGARGWVRGGDVDLTQHDYRVRVELDSHQLTAYKGKERILRETVAVGSPKTPTSTGVYFTTMLLKPPDPRGPYGAYAFGLSGYSDVLTRYKDGNGEMGIHGTNDKNSLGRSISHGCIRLSNEAVSRLAGVLPLGTPVFIET